MNSMAVGSIYVVRLSRKTNNHKYIWNNFRVKRDGEKWSDDWIYLEKKYVQRSLNRLRTNYYVTTIAKPKDKPNNTEI